MKNKKAVTKKVIATKIHQKLGMALNKRVIQDAINAICACLQDNIERDRAVSVENFGTISPYVFHSHSGMNIATGELREVPAFHTVRFHPHFIFLELLARRREAFLEKK